jgi:colanic acid biosynthesis glycosyl transferase WcaI
MPSKVYEIMASGRPLLASADRGSDVWQLVERTGCGICVEPGDAARLAAAVMTLYRDPERRATMGRQGRACAERDYSTHAVVVAYDRLLRRVARGVVPVATRPNGDFSPARVLTYPTS